MRTRSDEAQEGTGQIGPWPERPEVLSDFGSGSAVAPTSDWVAVPSILATSTAVPAHVATQDELKRVVGTHFLLGPRERRLAMAAFEQADIETRYAAVPVEDLGRTRSLDEASRHYREGALRLGAEVARGALAEAGILPRAIDLVISVSCTGIMIPSLDAHLVALLGLRPDVRRLPLTELGCAGGAAALARAHEFLVGRPEAHVLVVAVELPSLSLQPSDPSEDNLVSTALFGDGAAAAVLANRREGALAILETTSHLLPDSLPLLGFELRHDGFHSVLKRDVTTVLRAHVPSLVDDLAARQELRRRDLAFLVLHTGGKKILRCLEEELGLDPRLTRPSWDVLRRYGNQSSASVLFVLHQWLTRQRPSRGSYGLLAAFGPGLSAEMLLLQERL